MKRIRYDRDTGTPLSTRQEQEISSFFLKQQRPISLAIFEDGQSPILFLEYLFSIRLGYNPGLWEANLTDYIYNLASYIGQSKILADSLQEKSQLSKIIVLYAGASLIDNEIVSLIKYLINQQFDTGPEIVLLFDRLDIEHNKQGIRNLFPKRNTLDLTFWRKEDNDDEMEEILKKHMNLPGFPW